MVALDTPNDILSRDRISQISNVVRVLDINRDDPVTRVLKMLFGRSAYSSRAASQYIGSHNFLLLDL